MKFLLKIFKSVEPAFKDQGKFKAWYPLYEAMENFFFAPATTAPNGPHLRDPLDIKRFMSMVIIALVPCLAAGFYFFGWRIAAMVIVSYLSGGIVEVAFAIIRKEQIQEGFLVTGMIFPLILPPATPLWMVALGCMFGVCIGKELFGGTGRNVFNPAIVGRCFLVLAYPGQLAGKWIAPGSGLTGRMLEYAHAGSVDAIATATPIGASMKGEYASLLDMFIGNIPGCLGETSTMMIIAGGVFLLLTGVANWRIVVSTLGFSALFAWIFNITSISTMPVAWYMCAGGLMFGAFFMATDPVSGPVTNAGKWMYGFLIALITILIRNFSGFVEGVMFAILLANIAAPILDEMVVNIKLRRLNSEV